MRQLLSDLLVVDLSQEPAGAYCAKVFADLGARVVKIEPPDGDPMRARPAAFAHLNTNKLSVRADPARLERLLAQADLVVESAGAGDLAAFGVDRAALMTASPTLVVATVSGFGVNGPYASYRWTDLVAQVASWFTLPQGRAAVVPVKLPRLTGLSTLGHTAALGGLVGVLRARASGAGTHIDCAAYEALACTPSRVGRFLGWEYRDREVLPPMAVGTSSMLIPTGVFPCADGHVSLMSTPQQLQEMLTVLDDDDLRAAFARPDALTNPDTKAALDAALYPWLFSHTRAEAIAIAQAAGWPFGYVNEPHEVLEVDHLHQRGFWVDADDPAIGPVKLTGAPYRHAEAGWRLHRPSPRLGADETQVDSWTDGDDRERVSGAPVSADTPPLRGIRVLDLTTVWSGPYVTQLLADLGAEVIRVENPSVFPPTTKGYVPRPPTGTQDRATGAGYAPLLPGQVDRPYNRHSMNNSIARNKLSCTLDPRRPEAHELFMQLVAQSDVIIENLKSTTFHQMGLQEGRLLDVNPRLLVVRLPPAGLTGDWSGYTGFGGQFDGLTGLAFLTGHHDSELVDTPTTTYMDGVTGPACAFAIAAALHYRDATGRGQVIELAQSENVLNHLGDVFIEEQLGNEQRRLGNREPGSSPQGVFATGDDRWLAISTPDDSTWVALAEAIDRADLAADPELATEAGRYARYDELEAVLAAWCSTRDVMPAFHELQAAGIPAAPLYDDDLLVADPNVIARGWVRPLRGTETGEHLHLGHAINGLPQVWERSSPALGEDNEYVFKKVLGLDDARYNELAGMGIIVQDYLDRDGNPV